ncbi:MAG: hypothetical protein ACR2PI_19525 [Hyphomicrobiaceae bacterium]
MTGIALDTNLLLLFVIGSAIGDAVGKRLKSYTQDDWVVLRSYLEQADRLISTPNVWTEVSNICTFGVKGDWEHRIRENLILSIHGAIEIIRPSCDVTDDPEFAHLGLTDCVWLAVLNDEDDIVLLTDDVPLYNVALSRGLNVKNFTHLRELD